MAQIPRPPKQGNVMTYVAKVAAGYPHILAGEMDADLDTIYGAWNSGADSANIRDGAITSAKLAADSVGPRELQDNAVQTAHLATTPPAVTTPTIADGAVTDPKIVSVSWTKIGGTPSTFPAGGVAGGDLTGSYPNPLIRDGAVTAAKMAPGTLTGDTITADTITTRELADNAVATANLQDGAVTRPKLAPGSLQGATQATPIPAFSTAVQNTWVPVATLPALTTRGANPVFLFTNHGLAALFTGVPGNVMVRWTRGGAHVCATAFSMNGLSGIASPVPSLPWMDFVPAAGAYVYRLEVFLSAGTATVYFAAGVTDCLIAAVELG